jgi:hypothetical protein
MKRTWQSPGLVEYGTLGQLTLGQHSNFPDYNQDGTAYVNDNCDPTNSGPGSSGNSNPFSCEGSVQS